MCITLLFYFILIIFRYKIKNILFLQHFKLTYFFILRNHSYIIIIPKYQLLNNFTLLKYFIYKLYKI
jgi:hypothetical protein